MRPPTLEHILLEGERVRLRPPMDADVDPAFAILHGNRAILDWLVWSGPETPEDVAKRFSTWRAIGAVGDNYSLAIVDLEDGSFAGSISLRMAEQAGRARVGYWVDPKRWRRGLATEAVKLATWLAFEHFGVDDAYAWTFTDNYASRGVLEKCGFRAAEPQEIPPLPSHDTRAQWAFRLLREDFETRLGIWRPVRLDLR
jgi:RimJ/RimL family protein N-acetyltransferase